MARIGCDGRVENAAHCGVPARHRRGAKLIEKLSDFLSVQRDGTDFVVAFQPEGHVIFRHHDLKALRRVCSKLRWEVLEEKSFPLNLDDIHAYLSGSE